MVFLVGRAGGRLRALAALAVFGAGLLLSSSCQVVDTTSITNAIQTAIDSANRQSDAWRGALSDLTTNLNDLESKASGDVKSTVNDTLNSVSDLRTQALDQAAALTKDTVAFTLIQAQCSVDYFKSSVVSYLQYLKARVTNRNAPLPKPRVCNFNPDHFDIDPSTLSGSNKTWLTKVYGYNFLPQALPVVRVVDGANHLVREAKNQPVRTSLYEMQLQLLAADFAGLAQGYRVGLAWANGDSNYIPVDLSSPAELKLLDFQVQAAVLVNQPVLFRVVVKNGGTTDSGNFQIRWLPDANRGHVETQSILNLAGNETKTVDLASFVYSQATYFNIPSTQPAPVQTTVQLVGNSGVGANSQGSRSFTLSNLPFRKLQPVRIDNPVVDHDWTSYQYRVPVQPGDIVTIVDAGGCVQTGGSGATWKRYVNPDAPDSPNLYHGLVGIVPVNPSRLEHGNPPSGPRIADLLGVPIAVPLNTFHPEFFLGYEDSAYGDNGYWGHDDGTNGQCRDFFGAWVTVQIQRN